jgi:hypothetical protein
MMCVNCKHKNYIIRQLKKLAISLNYENGKNHNTSIKLIEDVLGGKENDYLNETLELSKKYGN